MSIPIIPEATMRAILTQRIVLRGMQWRCADCSRVYEKVRKIHVAAKCPDCGSRRSARYCLVWFQTADGEIHNTNALAHMGGVMRALRGDEQA